MPTTPTDVHTVLAELESLGTAQNRKVYGRHGVQGPLFGVSYANQDKLRKRLGRDHELAVGLWASGNHDARILATKIADPVRADDILLDAWVAELDNYVESDAFSKLAARAPGARGAAERWVEADGEWVERSGWLVLTHLILAGELEDEEMTALLPRIEAQIHSAKNRVRDAMNSALIAIGSRSDVLEETAIAAARRIGTVEVDHGATGCKTPDAEPYIRKTRARQRQREAKTKA